MNNAHRVSGSTTANLNAILDVIRAQTTGSVTLFATAPRYSPSANEVTPGDANNLPYVAALAEINIKPLPTQRVVFDGCFLTAARRPRFLEVVELLDEAVRSGKVHFVNAPVPFTQQLSPALAANVLGSIGPRILLDEATRPQYFSLLSSLSESEYERSTR